MGRIARALINERFWRGRVIQKERPTARDGQALSGRKVEPSSSPKSPELQTPEIIGPWQVVKRDPLGKRLTARCGSCGSIRELSVPAIEAGQRPHCSGCTPSNPSGHSQQRSYAEELAVDALRGARQRHRGGGL
jgi:hypothetical protein